jgi:hypothetical protein
MKTKEEIEQLAEEFLTFHQDGSKVYHIKIREAIEFAYTQCQQDVDWELLVKLSKMYTEEDMIKFAFDTYCYISGIMKVPFNKVSENRTHAEDNFKDYINSLNKQKNE